VISINRAVAREYAIVKTDLWSRGRPPGDNDLWIAATARAHGLILITNDAAFGNIRGLTIEDWSRG